MLIEKRSVNRISPLIRVAEDRLWTSPYHSTMLGIVPEEHYLFGGSIHEGKPWDLEHYQPTQLDFKKLDSSKLVLGRIIQELALDPDIQSFFTMDGEEIISCLDKITTTTDGFRVSPGFESPGWGRSMRDPRINLSDIFNSEDVIRHEMKHGLHYFCCKRLFDAGNLVNFELFKENVIKDRDFGEWLSANGSSIMLSVAEEIDSWNLGKEEAVKRFSWVLGALTYQHAYFVDPAMCEAVASYKDRGVVHIINQFNHMVSFLLLPGNNGARGYADVDAQKLFRNANSVQRSLLVPAGVYQREVFFS